MPGRSLGRNMKKYFLYLKYLLKHKYYVFVAGLKLGVNPFRLLWHDYSKFYPDEWFPYVNYFYGYADSKQDSLTFWNKERAFDRAWLLHQHRSPHHYQFWILREDSGATKVLEMPTKYVKEMLADWLGAGKAITGRWEVATWYEKNKANIILAPKTRQLVEKLLSEYKC